MAQSILQKIGILVSATLHSIVDRALESRSVAVFDEYIRQASESMRTIEAALVDLKATVRTLHSKYNAAADEAAKLDLQIDAALKAGRESVAKASLVKLNSLMEIAHTYKDQYEKQNKAFNTLSDVVQVLQSKVDVLRAQRDQVATLIEIVKTKNVAARSIKDIEKIDDGRAEQIMNRVKAEMDTADARLEVATMRLSAEIEETVGDLSIEAQLEERRQRLGLG